MTTTDKVLLLIEVPRTNDKKELAAEQMFAALHGILRPSKKGFFRGDSPQDYISFEIAAIAQRIHFYIWMPADQRHFVEGQIYAQYSTAQISPLSEDYAHLRSPSQTVYMTELGLNTYDSIPIKTFSNFEVDPLSGITAALARLDPDEEIWIQVLARPVADDWHEIGSKHIKKIESGGGLLHLGSLVSAPFSAPSEPNDAKTNISERDQSRIAAIKQKNTKLGYQAKIRIVYIGPSEMSARLRIQALVGAFKQFNTTDLNGFRQQSDQIGNKYLIDYQSRKFDDAGFVLNIEELASIFHLPHTSVDTPNIGWALSKTAEPPASLPTPDRYQPGDLSLFATSNFRGTNTVFGSLRSDRNRHIYVIGQTGTGKSGLLELLALSDLNARQGYAIVDPHGDFAVNTLNSIPADRVADVIYFNPVDVDYPIGFNPLEYTDPRQKVQISSELVITMKRMFDSWGPRLEYILRNTILALLDTPGSTMLDITRMLTDKKFRKRVVANVSDIVVRNFWETEFATWGTNFQTEAVAPVLNKVGAFTANPMIRNIIGQPKGSFNIRHIMDQGRILVLNLSRGLIGEDNASILGAMIITKIQLAAMSRADIQNIEDRRPFYLYVDEFQNFATDSFAVILSEARKYGLYLTLANQYISQVPEEVRSAVFGNVGSIVSFRVSPDDAPFLEKYFSSGAFVATDIIQLANRNFVATLTINGEKPPAFSGRTLDLPNVNQGQSGAIIDYSRQHYATPRNEVEAMIEANVGPSPNQNQPQPKPNRRPERSRSQPTKRPKTQHSKPKSVRPFSNNQTLKNIHKSLQSETNQTAPNDQPAKSVAPEPQKPIPKTNNRQDADPKA